MRLHSASLLASLLLAAPLLSVLVLIACTVDPALAQPSAAPAPADPPDAVYYHGRILTGEGLGEGHFRFVTALVLSRGQIVAATSDDAALKLAGSATRKINLAGAFVMPGFNDAHVHLAEAGRIKLAVNLTGTTSLDDMKERVRLAAMATPPGQWLVGGGWDQTLWPAKVLPARSDLDAVTQGHPAIFTRVDSHIAVANSAALAAAGISRNTGNPSGGSIDRDPHGEPTGILREEPAMKLVWDHAPKPTEAQRRRGLELAMADAVIHGVTSAQDNSDWEDFLVMETMEQEGKLPLRVTEWLPFDAPLDQLKQQQAAHPADDPMLHTGMLKGYLDGSLGSRTAAMLEPYTDDPANSGLLRYDQATLNMMTTERAQAGFQIGFHAIGDRATEMALRAFAAAEASAKKAPQPNASLWQSTRNRIEHAQVVNPADISRFRSLHVIASMQPNHLLTDMRWAEARLGPAHAKHAYAWKAFLNAGVPLAFGTDYPIEPVTPFRGVYAAVTRKDEAGKQSFYPENVLSLAQALYACTQGSAYAEHSEQWKGKLTPGYAADFIVLDRDLTAIPPAEILKTKVLRTIVGGNQVATGGIRIAGSK
ncbi:MAG TPA: amidohydrolase [Acidisarcina sp.]|nr:amidohydrolase [Acidisarcina sp.]